MSAGAAALLGAWIHAHEEDSGDEIVFRPASHPLPPSRGRNGFELRAGGELVEKGPGPTDKVQTATGVWRLDGDELSFAKPGAAPHAIYRVVSAAPDRLVLRRK